LLTLERPHRFRKSRDVGCYLGEVVGGLLLLAGLTTRLIAGPFVAEMIVAILSTKISLYLGTSPLPLPPVPPQVGFWAVLHEVRSEYAQILRVMFLLVNGPGEWSLDAVLPKTRKAGLSELVPSGRPVDLAGATSG
jgi:putative oxidoreductase